MSNVPTNLIPSTITQLPEYTGTSTLGFLAYSLNGRTYKVQFSNIAAVGAVPSTRVIATGNGLQGGGDLSQDRTISIISHGVGYSQLDFTGVVAGTYGAADTVPVFTVDATGRISSVTDTPIVLSGYVPTSRTVTAGAGLIGGGSLSGNITLSLNPSDATPLSLGVASAGTGTQAARDDHVHPAVDLTDTSETQGVLPLGRGGTGDALSPVVGAVIYADTNSLNQTTAGNAGQVLTSAGGSSQPYWSDAGTVTSVDLTAGTGISVSGGPITTVGSITVTNTAPDQIVSLTAGTNVTITGTYPNFTIAATGGGGGGSGTVTSVDASGGTTGLTFSGGPITTSGTLTLAGTLAVASGGTGATAAGTARANLGAAASGANSDITSMSGITGGITAPDYVTFDVLPATTPTAVGSLYWDSADGIQTLNLVMAGGVTQQIGEEQYFRIKATAAVADGDCVMFTGSVGASGGLTGQPASGVNTGQYIMGVATQSIALNGWGYITQFGLVRNIDTSGSSVGETWADGDILYYNPAVAGGLTKTAPVAPNPKVVVAAVVYASAVNGSLFVRVQSDPALQGLSDVYAPSPITDGQLLIGDGTQGRWESATLTAGTNVSITNAAGSVTINATDQYVGTVTSVSGTGTVNGITLTGTVTSSGSLTLGGTLSGVSLTTQVSGTLPVGNGGTGATTLTGLVVGNGTSAFTTVTAPSGTVVGTTDTQTLTNKRITPRINAQTTTTSPWAWNSDSYDQQSFSALANALTINADAGTPTDGQKAMFRFKDNGSAQSLTWTTGTSNSFRAVGVTLPTTTVISKTVYVGCVYNAADSRWDAVAVAQEA